MAKGAPIYKLAIPGEPLRASSAMLRVRWNELLAWAEKIHDPQCVADLHNMRIAAKRLRYTLEIFAAVLPSPDPTMRKVEEIQERIGKIHDCDVIFPLLQRTLEREMKRERKQALDWGGGPPPFLAAEGLVALMSRKRDERMLLYNDFITWWDELTPEDLGASLEQLISGAPEGGGVGTNPVITA